MLTYLYVIVLTGQVERRGTLVGASIDVCTVADQQAGKHRVTMQGSHVQWREAVKVTAVYGQSSGLQDTHLHRQRHTYRVRTNPLLLLLILHFLSHLMCRRTAGTLAERVTQQSLNFLFILLFLICPFEQETHLYTHSFREGDQLRRSDYFPFLLTISTSASATARSSFSTCQSYRLINSCHGNSQCQVCLFISTVKTHALLFS